MLIAAFYPMHEHCERSLGLLVRSGDGEIGCAAHSLAEVYAGLTAMPGKKRVNGDEALLYLQSIRAKLTIIALSELEYIALLEEAAALGITSGAIYDAIVGKCAMKADAESLYTWNAKHFLRLGPSIASRVKLP